MQFGNTSRYFPSFFCSGLCGRMLNLFAKRCYNHNEASGCIMNRLLGKKYSDAIDRNVQGVDVPQLNLQNTMNIYVKLCSLFSSNRLPNSSVYYANNVSKGKYPFLFPHVQLIQSRT